MTDIGPKRFRLIFRGELEPGTDPDEARAVFRERFRVGDKTLENCFSGRKVALRSKLSEAEAFRLQADLQAAGLVTKIEGVPGMAPPPPPPPEEPAAAAPSPAVPEEPVSGPPASESAGVAAGHQAACRQCDAPINTSALHCPYCGARQEERGNVWAILAVVALLVFLLLPLSAAMVLPHLQQSRNHDHVAQAIDQGETTAEKVREFMLRTGFRPNSNLDAGLPKPAALAKPPLAEIRVSEGALITLRFQPDLPDVGDRTILFVPRTDEQGQPSWICRPGTLPVEQLPPSCRPAGLPEPSPVPADTTMDTGVDHGQPQSRSVSQRVIQEEIGNSMPILQRMLAFHASRGRWPHDNAELSLEEPGMLGSYAARGISVLPNGELQIEFIASVAGDRTHTTLVLYRDQGRWLCRSRMPASVLPDSCRRAP